MSGKRPTVLDLYPTLFIVTNEPASFPPYTSCWLYVGNPIAEGGYALLEYYGKWVRGNRLSMRLAGKPLNDDQMACHTCDKKPCCNPDHLFAGSNSENQLDLIKWSSVLTPEQISEIKADKRTTDRLLAKKYRITKSQVHWLRSKSKVPSHRTHNIPVYGCPGT